MAPRNASFWKRLIGQRHRRVPESSNSLQRTLARVLSDVDRKYPEAVPSSRKSDVGGPTAKAS